MRFLVALTLAFTLSAPSIPVFDTGDVVQSHSESFDEASNTNALIEITTTAVTTGNTIFVWALYVSNAGTTNDPVMTGVTFAEVTGMPQTAAAVGSCTGGTVCEVSLWRGVVDSGGATAFSHTISYGNLVFLELEGDVVIFDDSHGTDTASTTLNSGAATSDEAGKAFGFYWAIDAPTSTGGFTEIIENCDVTIAYCVGVADQTTSAATAYTYTSSDAHAGWNAFVIVANGEGAPPASGALPALIGARRGGGE